jgi:hypothetical protein
VTSIKVTPDVQARLQQLEATHGRLTPAVVVDDARLEDSPLHAYFDWDVDRSAMRYWLHRARVLIHSVRVEVTTERITVKAPYYVRDASLSAKEQGYVSVASLQKDPVSARASLREEFARVESALARARSIAAALGLERDLDDLIDHVMRVKERAAA